MKRTYVALAIFASLASAVALVACSPETSTPATDEVTPATDEVTVAVPADPVQPADTSIQTPTVLTATPN